MKSMFPLVSLSLQVPGVALLYFVAIQMAWPMQTWKGESKEEKAFGKKQLTTGITGLTLILIGYIFILTRIKKRYSEQFTFRN